MSKKTTFTLDEQAMKTVETIRVLEDLESNGEALKLSLSLMLYVSRQRVAGTRVFTRSPDGKLTELVFSNE